MKKVVVTGFMGTGKSTIEKLLADKLKCTFIDLDSYIEQVEQKQIKDIFKEAGETGFRKIETTLLNKVIAQHTNTSLIISTGGGTLIKKENFILLQNWGYIINLESDSIEIADRVKIQKITRPLLKNNDNISLDEKIEVLKKERENIYNKADVTIINKNSKQNCTISTILKWLESHSLKRNSVL